MRCVGLSGKLKVGIVGLGTFGQVHLEAYSGYHRSEIEAICDLDVKKGEEFSLKYGCDFYSSYEEMFSEADIEAVSIATPDFLHREPAVLAAEAGLDILLEKPMATTVQDANHIIEAVERAGSTIMIDFHNRFSPPFVALKRSIERGEMGSPRYIRANLNDTIYVPTKMLSWSAKSNVLWFLASHLIDLCRWILSSDPRRVLCKKGEGVLSSSGIDTPDYYHSLLEFESGAVASLENCWILPESHPSVYKLEMEFVGSEGSYSANVSHSNMSRKYTKDRQENPDMLFDIDLHGRPRGFAVESIYHFVDSVMDGERPLVGPEDGLWVTKTITALLESARSDSWVDLSQL